MVVKVEALIRPPSLSCTTFLYCSSIESFFLLTDLLTPSMYLRVFDDNSFHLLRE